MPTYLSLKLHYVGHPLSNPHLCYLPHAFYLSNEACARRARVDCYLFTESSSCRRSFFDWATPVKLCSIVRNAIFARRGAGVHNMVWHGDQRKKTFLLVIEKDRKRRECTPAPDLRINGERLKTLDINDACRYLGYWGTGIGDMSATREVVREKKSVSGT